MAEVEKKEEITSPEFEICEGNKEFFVKIPKDMGGAWIKSLGGTFNQPKKAYTFLLSKLARVEDKLNLKEGESGLKDPSCHFSIQLIGTVYSEKGYQDLRARFKEAGIDINWSNSTKSFHGDLDDYAKLGPYLSK